MQEKRGFMLVECRIGSILICTMHPQYYGGYNGGLNGIGFVGELLWWALLILLIIGVVRWLRSTGPGPHPHHPFFGPPAKGPDPAIDVLRERYAKGEIDKREYDERLRDMARP